jgi:hypothetical protein
MGYIKHHTIVVTGWSPDKVVDAHQKAKEIFTKNFKNDAFAYTSCVVSEIVKGAINGQSSFFVAPDGSKEGWSTSDYGDISRKEFLDWLHNSDNYCDYIEIIFGGDSGYETILRSKDKDLHG